MKIYSEQSLSDFEFWSGGKETADYLTDEEFNQVESILEEMYPDGIDETALNDFFWYEEDTIAKWLGYSSFEKIMSRDDEDEDEEEDFEDEDDEEDEDEEDE